MFLFLLYHGTRLTISAILLQSVDGGVNSIGDVGIKMVLASLSYQRCVHLETYR